jgi:adenosylmethionine-8-amino-7-oxononanoate aminotransferase
VTHVLHRVVDRALPMVDRARGAVIWDADGNRYLDAAGGAIVVGVGHGDVAVLEALQEQLGRAAYAHGTQFTSAALEDYADDVSSVLPVDDARIYPVSGGSEAVETALKLARTYHLARGDHQRHKVVARAGSYHGNTRGALDASGRELLRRPYEPWLGQTVRVPAVYEYRCPLSCHPASCGKEHARVLEETFEREGPETVACFLAEPVSGAALGAAVPPPDYWSVVEDVCRRHGVLIVVDEVMSGFGRTGRWFGCDHWGVRPDLLAAAKGASSGYWPFGFAACSGAVFDTVRAGGFTHGFTYSHSPVGASVAHAVLRRLRSDELVEASRTKGERLQAALRNALGGRAYLGDIRGLGLLIGVELVTARDTRAPFARSERVTERVLAAARERGLLLYPSTGGADGVNGDVVMLGPPFVISEDQLDEAVAKLAAALDEVLGTGLGGSG